MKTIKEIEELIDKLIPRLQNPSLPNYIHDEYEAQLAFYKNKLT